MLCALVALGWAACGCPGPRPAAQPGAGPKSGTAGERPDAGPGAVEDAGAQVAADPVAAGRAVEAGDAAAAKRRFGSAASAEATDYLAARIAELAGDRAGAAQLYQKVAAAAGELAPRARRGAVRCWEACGDHAAAAAALEALPKPFLDALTAGERRAVAASRGRHLVALGRTADAVAAFAAATVAADERTTVELAEAHAAAGDAEKAIALLRPLADDAKRAATMQRAEAALAALGAAPARKEVEILARARRLIDLRAFDDAAAAVAPLLDSKNAKVAAEAAWLEAEQLYARRRHYAEAVAALDRIIAKGGGRAMEARWLRAAALARGDREPEAIEAYAELGRKEKLPGRAAEARFLGGRLAFYIGRHADALAGMEKLVGKGMTAAKPAAKKGKKGRPGEAGKAKPAAKKEAAAGPLPKDRALEAHFIAGMAALLDGKPARAAAHFAVTSVGEESAEALERNRYWLAVARAEADPTDGAALLAEICAADTTTWYAAHARRRLADAGADAAGCAPIALAKPAEPARAADPPLAELSAAAALLASVGLYREAAEELRRAEDAGAKADDGSFVRHYLALDAPQHAIRRAARGLAWPPAEADLQRWRAAYPTPFAEEVRRLEERHGLPSLLLYAVARKESLFDPEAVSGAGALGLMQMMPATYEANRKLAGLPPLAAGALPGPHESLAAASFELESLVKRFDGSLPLAIMAYNGGAAAVAHWRERAGGEPIDVFVEKAGFVETRNYVRRVYQNLVRYRLLDGLAPPELPATAPPRRSP